MFCAQGAANAFVLGSKTQTAREERIFLKIGAGNHQICAATSTYLQPESGGNRVWRQQSPEATRVWRQQSLEATESGGNKVWRQTDLGAYSVNHANGRRVTSSHVLRTGRSEHICFGVKNANGSRETHVFENRSWQPPDLCRDKHLPTTRVWRQPESGGNRVWRQQSLEATRVWRQQSLEATESGGIQIWETTV